jgi:hypothetical protein
MRTKKVSIAAEKPYAEDWSDTSPIFGYAYRMMTICGLQQKHSRPAVLSPVFRLLNCLGKSSFRFLILVSIFAFFFLFWNIL